MKLIERMEKGELHIVNTENCGGFGSRAYEEAYFAGKEHAELLRLARIGEHYIAELEMCAKEMSRHKGWTCDDNTCPGHMYCRTYKAEVIAE